MKSLASLVLFLTLHSVAAAQTFTMGNKCYARSKVANEFLAEKKFNEALSEFTAMESSCKTKDAREIIQAGKAAALNGLGQYQEALNASAAAIKISKNKSVKGYFQQAISYKALNRNDEANASFEKLISLTEKNRDLKARASNYALLADLHKRQLGHTDSAVFYMQKAKALDPDNLNFTIIEGDWMVWDKQYDRAFALYDECVAKGKNDLDMYISRSRARLKSMVEKYQTNNTQELRSKMTSLETELLCKEYKRAIQLGWNDLQQELFSSLICK